MFYGKGYVSGKIVYDNVALMSMEVESIPLKMLAVDVAEDLEGTQADGILGLSPEPTTGSESFVKKMAENGVIDASQFTVFIGSTEESSYIDFGKYKGDTINTTWVDIINPNYWSVIFNSFSYKNKDISLPSRVAVLDTGTSILGFPRGDLANIIAAVREERQLYYLEDINFYAVQWNNISEFYDLVIDINGHTTRIPSEEYMLQIGKYCIFFLFDLGTRVNFILLGDTYLKGNMIIHDIDNKKVGIFPQKLYYEPRVYEESFIIFTILIIVVLALFVVCIVALVYYHFYKKKHNQVEEESEVDAYELIGENERRQP